MDTKKELEKMVIAYTRHLVTNNDPDFHPELEFRFTGSITGTTQFNGKTKPISQLDYDNVLQIFKSSNPTSINATTEGKYLLRIYPFVNGKQSPFRCEIYGMKDIQIYCDTNDWKKCSSARFVRKDRITDKGKPINDLFMDKYAVKVSYKSEVVYAGENIMRNHDLNNIATNWDKLEKTYRHILRTSINTGSENLFILDASIVKSSSQNRNGIYIPMKDIHQSNVFTNPEKYEIEIEMNNKAVLEMIGEDMPITFSTPVIIDALTERMGPFRQVLMGLQNTHFPITAFQMYDTLRLYYDTIYGKIGKKFSDFKEHIPQDTWTNNKNFIGPSLVGLEFENISEEITPGIPNIRRNYAVTPKTDGERCLLFISPFTGNVDLIDMNMNVRSSGIVINIPELKGTLLDGEYVARDINGDWHNTFYAFDLYFLGGVDIRSKPFMNEDFSLNIKDPSKNTNRYYPMVILIENYLHPGFEIEGVSKNIHRVNKNALNITSKRFICVGDENDFVEDGMIPTNIFECCREVLSDQFQVTNYDGLVFIPKDFAVGANEKSIRTPGPLRKMRWGYNMKWKPAKYNTNDFLATFKRKKDGKADDEVKYMYIENTNNASNVQNIRYKILELRCGFSHKNSGIVNACSYILDERGVSTAINMLEDKYQYSPTLFYPSEYPDDFAHICYVEVRPDNNGILQMFTEEGEIFDDNMIIEFRYDKNNKEGFRWIPLRIRHDKTYEYRNGGRSYGNDYETANGNWRTIHNPITEEMITSGQNIPTIQEVGMNEDVYYNKSNSGSRDVLQKLHNYIKLQLILSNSVSGQTMIDFACGKGGDLWKWDEAQLSFVFGIDYSRDNIENRFDGACSRYLKDRQKGMKTRCLFVIGDCSKNIRNGDGLLNDRQKEITNNVMGVKSKSENMIGTLYGVGANGFNLGSCQFAIHYFFKNVSVLSSFMTNLVQNIQLGGLFLGTCFDGKKLYNTFIEHKTNKITITTNGMNEELYWYCVQKYDIYNFGPLADDSSCLGMEVDVFQKSIGKVFTEYLVNFDYMTRVMDNYGFELVSITPFKTFLENMPPHVYEKYKEVEKMDESFISYLNSAFVYRKVRDIDPRMVTLDETPFLERKKIELELPLPDVEESPYSPAMTPATESEEPIPDELRRLLHGNVEIVEKIEEANVGKNKEEEEVPILITPPTPPPLKKPPAKPKATTKSKPKCKEDQELVDDRCLKKCKEDEERNPETNRCRKIKGVSKKKEKKNEELIEDVELSNAIVANLPSEVRSPSKRQPSPLPLPPTPPVEIPLEKIAEEKIEEPKLIEEKAEEPKPKIKKTRKCKPTEELVDDRCLKKCDEDQFRNPVTKRCNKTKKK
jgi:mRNA capping enzyme